MKTRGWFSCWTNNVWLHPSVILLWNVYSLLHKPSDKLPGKTLCLAVIPSRVPSGLTVALWILHDRNSVFSSVLMFFLVEPRCLQHITRKQCILSPGDHLALKQVLLVISTYPYPVAVALETQRLQLVLVKSFWKRWRASSVLPFFSFPRSEITNLTIAWLHLSILSNRAHSAHS